ncbi:MAG: hypothetical protein K5694_05230 [Bacilli bacterium]|nr:hypothetical protein [Bacilli bacterium]
MFGYINNLRSIKETIDKKDFLSLSPHWQTILRRIFPSFDEGFIKVYICKRNKKADLRLYYRNQCVNVAVRNGHKMRIHIEDLASFYQTLKKHRISRTSLALFLFYQFGDGTTRGNGRIRLNSKEIKNIYPQNFYWANKEINSNPLLLEEIIEKAIKAPFSEEDGEIDFYYYGNEKFGYLAESDEIIDYLKAITYERSSTISFGPFAYSPLRRNLKWDKALEGGRYKISLYWPKMIEDLQEIEIKRKELALPYIENNENISIEKRGGNS